MRQLGTHLLVDLCGCDSALLDSVDAVCEALMTAAEKAHVTVLDKSFHKFSPQGVTGVVVLAESHISVHTWPEEQFAAVDVFTCGDEAMPQLAVSHMIQAFTPEKYRVNEIRRGVPEASGKGATSPEWKDHVSTDPRPRCRLRAADGDPHSLFR